MHHEEARRILPVAKISGTFTERISGNPFYTRSSQNSSCTQFRKASGSGAPCGRGGPDGKAHTDLRLTFLGSQASIRSKEARASSLWPKKVIVAHGRWYERDGTKELCRACRWL